MSTSSKYRLDAVKVMDSLPYNVGLTRALEFACETVLSARCMDDEDDREALVRTLSHVFWAWLLKQRMDTLLGHVLNEKT